MDKQKGKYPERPRIRRTESDQVSNNITPGAGAVNTNSQTNGDNDRVNLNATSHRPSRNSRRTDDSRLALPRPLRLTEDERRRRQQQERRNTTEKQFNLHVNSDEGLTNVAHPETTQGIHLSRSIQVTQPTEDRMHHYHTSISLRNARYPQNQRRRVVAVHRHPGNDPIQCIHPQPRTYEVVECCNNTVCSMCLRQLSRCPICKEPVNH